MDNKVIYAWQVVGDYNDFVHFTCATQSTAKYLRDLMQAYEENMWRDTAVKCDVPYKLLHANANQQLFSIQECEVLL